MHATKESILYTKPLSQSHLNHHKTVLNDGTVVSNSHIGMIFSWLPATVIMSIYGTVLFYSLSKALTTNYSLKIIIIMSVVISVFYGIIWNTVHPAFHDIKLKYSISEGFPSFDIPQNIKKNPILIWLWKNHICHHLNKGNNKCNYNIILPFADFIMGTYENKIDNVDYCKLNINNKDKKIKNLCKSKLEINDIVFK